MELIRRLIEDLRTQLPTLGRNMQKRVGFIAGAGCVTLGVLYWREDISWREAVSWFLVGAIPITYFILWPPGIDRMLDSVRRIERKCDVLQLDLEKFTTRFGGISAPDNN